MAQNGPEGPECPEWAKMAQNGPEGPKWLMGPNMAQGAQNCSDGPEIIKESENLKISETQFFLGHPVGLIYDRYRTDLWLKYDLYMADT